MRLSRLTFCLAAAGLAACSATQKDRTAVAAAPAQPASGIVLGAIPVSSLPKGECGMVLWTLDENRPLAVFRYVAGKQAEIVIGRTPVTLSRGEIGGASAFGVFEKQKFTSEDGLALSVDVRFSIGFDGGSYLERGLITIEDAEGWRTVAPTAGLAGCRS